MGWLRTYAETSQLGRALNAGAHIELNGSPYYFRFTCETMSSLYAYICGERSFVR
jgi:hypothetical protein